MWAFECNFLKSAKVFLSHMKVSHLFIFSWLKVLELLINLYIKIL